jgi:GPH family glycoside/pentoside/hexuronide:cation symporter
VPATNGLALAGINLVTTAMLADIISADELATHQRRGGLYASVISWLDKVGSSTGALLSGFLLVGIGFDVQLGGQQSSYTLTSMKWIYAAFPMCAAVITVVLARKYTLTEARAYEVKQALERQQASEPQEESC